MSAILLLAVGCSSSDTAAAPGNTDGGGGSPSTGPEPKLPDAPADCPDIAGIAALAGGHGTVTVQGQVIDLWVGAKQADKKGPVLFYWHGTGSLSAEIQAFMGTGANPILAEIQAEGGVAASFTTSVGAGTDPVGNDSINTGNNVWFTGDFDSADILLACAVKQLNIDTHRIYAAGCSAGGLEAGAMAVMRSSYLAAAMPNSGGSLLGDFQDPTHIPSLITTHGNFAQDFVILHFSDVSKTTDQVFADKGGFSMDCDHGGGHCGAPAEAITAQWQFLKDHPFGVSTDPYANGVPSSFPSYCTPFSAMAAP